MLDNIYDINEITNDDLDQLLVDITVGEDKEKTYKKAFNKLFDITRKYVDSKSSSTKIDEN
jgi:hypothetical protein